jgi:small-conductance mechanosensitive channel
MTSTNTDTNSVLLTHVLTDTHLNGVWAHSTRWLQVLIILGLALLLHLLVKLIRNYSELLINQAHEKKHPFSFATHQPKFITITRLIVSAVTFGIYFIAVGLVVIVAFNFNDKVFQTYLSSAAVIGLGLSFGLQGLVQDVVTGVTLIFSNTMDIGDLVDLGIVGRVERIGLRFTKLTNFYNQEVFLPNRNIGNVSRFPLGGIYAYTDVQIPAQADSQKIIETVQRIAKGMAGQFSAIILEEPVLEKIQTTFGGWNYLRVRFKIWPGQGSLIETTFRAQVATAMKTLDANYTDAQIVVTYRANAAAPEVAT